MRDIENPLENLERVSLTEYNDAFYGRIESELRPLRTAIAKRFEQDKARLLKSGGDPFFYIVYLYHGQGCHFVPDDIRDQCAEALTQELKLTLSATRVFEFNSRLGIKFKIPLVGK